MAPSSFREAIREWVSVRHTHACRPPYRPEPEIVKALLSDLPKIIDVLGSTAWYSRRLSKADVDARDKGGRTALMWAAFTGDVNLARLLLERRCANVELCTCKHPLFKGLHVTTALDACCEAGSVAVAELLLSHGASPSPPAKVSEPQHDSYLATVVNSGSVPLASKCALLSMLIEAGADVNRGKRAPIETPLRLASGVRAQYEIVKLLLHKSADPNITCGETNSTCRTALLAACFLSASEEVVLLLLTHGADVGACIARGVTALHLAAEHANLNVCRLLALHGADVHAADEDGNPPIFDATPQSRGGGCLCLIDADLESKRNRVADFLTEAMRLPAPELRDYALRPWELHVASTLQDAIERTAICEPSTEPFASLLSCYAPYVDAQDYDGSTALHTAAQSGHVPVVRLLLTHGSSAGTAAVVTNVGETPLHLAAREGHVDVIRLLVAHRPSDLRSETRFGRTPLLESRHGGHAELAKLLEDATAQSDDAEAALLTLEIA